jgi:hypothetical protein
MFDNQPEYVKEFLDQDRIADLDQVLMLAAKPGWDLYHKLVKQGRSDLEARDLALELVIPSNGPEFSENPPEPLPLEEQKAVYKRLEAIEEREERAEDARLRRQKREERQNQENEEGYVSVVGQALIQPMFDLVEKLESQPPVPPNEVRTAQRENGYSLAIIVLCVILFESALNRTAYVRSENRSGPDYFADITDDKKTAAEVEEIFAARNVIAHNHLWEAKTTWDEETDLKFAEPPVLREGYGNKRHLKVTDQSTRKSKILGINMFPARIWRRDAYIALKTIAKGLNALESMDRRYFYLSPNHFRFQKKTVTFSEMTDQLPIPKDV